MLHGGVIGFGGVGQALTRYINEKSNRARIVAACNRGQPKLDLAEREYGLKVTHDVRHLCEWGLDFVLVVSSNYAHKEHVLAAAEKGLHIFCEKPISIALEDAHEMVRAVEQAGVTNTVNYSLRYAAMTDYLKGLVNRGDLGEILSVSYEKTRSFGLHAGGARHPAVERAEESGGWIIHHACHQIDFIYYLFGAFQDVYCTTRTTVPGGVSEEMVFANGRLRSGAMFHLCDSLAKIDYDHLVVTGSKASFASQLASPYHFDRMREERCAEDNVMSFERGWMVSRDKPHRSIEHFFDCIEGKATPVATLRSSLESLRVAHAMKASAATNAVVTLGTGRT